MRRVKGIILAGGYGTRLHPLTFGVSKQLLPVYDKPMIYYPLSTLMDAGINEILIITTIEDSLNFKNLLGDGSEIGIKISYAKQEKPNGIAEAFKIGSNFIGEDNVCLVLGDNIFHGNNFISNLDKAKSNLFDGYSTIFGVQVDNPNQFGVVQFNSKNEILKIIEKPKTECGNLIVSGLYYYTNEVIKLAMNLKPSLRGEYEITDINNSFLKKDNLKLIRLNPETVWTDTGTYDALIFASQYFKEFEKKFNKKVACIEEIAFEKGYINKSELLIIANKMKNSSYGKYLLKIVRGEN